MKKSYKQKTPYLGIPVLGHGDRIVPEVELRRFTIIENMLIAGVQGLSEVVFSDRSYSIDADGDSFTVSLIAGGGKPSVHGLASGIYFNAPPEIKWEKLKEGYSYHLYLTVTPETPYMKDSVRTVVSTTKKGKGYLLLATVDLREETPAIDSTPVGKFYSVDISKHTNDDLNPHGLVLEQDGLVIRKSLEFQDESVIKIGDSEIPIKTFASAASELAGRRVEKIDIMSGGSLGVVVKASSPVFSVLDIQRLVNGSFEGVLGETGIGYFGKDEKSDNESEFVVYNTGDENINLRILVMCE